MHNTRKNCCPHELWIMNADGSNPVRLARDVTGAVAWSPDERQIAYCRSRRGAGQQDLRRNADGSGKRLLTRSGLRARLVTGRAADRLRQPSGRQLGDLRDECRRGQAPEPHAHRRWRLPIPSGRRTGNGIAFVSRRDGNNEIYVMNADGSDQRNVTGDSGDDFWPVWSPDGQRISFVSRRHGTEDLRHERRRERPAKPPGRVESPAWSPDGQRIAFTSRRSGVSEIHVMNADGSRRTDGGAHRPRPGLGWSPDGGRSPSPARAPRSTW